MHNTAQSFLAWITTIKHPLQHSILFASRPCETPFILIKFVPQSLKPLVSSLGNPSHSFLLAFDVWYLTQLWRPSLLYVFPFDSLITKNLIIFASHSLCVHILLNSCMLQLPGIIWASNFPREQKSSTVATLKSNKHECS